MGCVCIKGICPVGDGEFHRVKHIKRLIRLSKKKGSPVVKPDVVDNENPVDTKNAVSKPQDDVDTVLPPQDTEGDTKAEGGADRRKKGGVRQRFATMEAIGNRDRSGVTDMPNDEGDQLKLSDVPNGFAGEHAAAGWPAWLTSVAGDAIKGWFPMSARSFEKLDKIGQGTYSNVYRARHLETGRIVALKKVRFINMDPESVRFMAREIHILRRLHHPNVIKLQGIITSRMSGNLYLVFEYMEHDLAGLAARPGVKFTEPQVKCYMQQFLEGLAHCHSKGILHRDIKGSNLLIDNNGVLKIADFGLATTFTAGQKEPLTSRVVTLWYRPPELLLGATEYGVAVDLWSSGCILAELFAGKPIMPGRTEVEQLHKIFKLCGSPSDEYWKKSKLPHATIFKPRHQYKRCIAETFREFPSSSLALLNSLLAIEPANRGTAASALASEFFKTKPLACDLSSLPKYPPSKEYNVKLRDAGNKRQKGDGTKDKSESVRPGRSEAKAIPPDANMVFQKSRVQENTKGAWCNTQDDNKGLELQGPGSSHSSLRVSNRTQLQTQRPCMPASGADDLSSSAAGKSSANSRYNRLDVAEASDKHTVDRPSSTHNKDNRTLSKVYGARHKGLHYSGPLIPPGGNVEDMLKEHERQIQQAVRKSRLDKVKS